MSSGLFEEAIADAKKIREVAEENAKKAVLEAVTPKIREFIESQILEQDNEKEDLASEEDDKDKQDEKDETIKLDETAINALLSLINVEDSTNNGSRDVMDLALSEAVSRLSASERKKLFDMTKKIDSRVENLNSRDLNNLKENKMQSREKYYEVDLKTLREALEEEENPMGEMLYEEEEELDIPEDDDLLADELGGEGEEGMISRDEVERQIEELISDLGLDIGADVNLPDEGPPELDLDAIGEDEIEEEEEAEQLDEVYDIDPAMLRSELRRLKSQINEGELGLAEESGGIEKDYEHHFGGKGSGNAGKGGSFGGGKPGKDVLAEMKEALRTQRRQKGALENKLTKYRSAVNTLREQLEELNLFNAKLLYVNKLLQNKQISESRKRSIVQALDEAKDLREAKVLYKSLTESFSQKASSKSGTLNESIRMGASSRTTKSASQISSQASGEVDRWARLAGLKK